LTGALSPVRRYYRRLAKLSFPQAYPIVEFPNAPLVVGLAALLLAGATHHDARSIALAVAYLALGIWAYLELLDGANLFRRLLGLIVIVAIALHLARLIRK
jgi:hypothetical protein